MIEDRILPLLLGTVIFLLGVWYFAERALKYIPVWPS